MLRAVFLDRDGVINDLIFNVKTLAFESPHFLKDLKIIPKALDGIKTLQKEGFEIFVVSNQPSYAKGKASLEDIKKIADDLKSKMEEEGVHVRKFYYCYHHPEGVVPDYTKVCDCRKPKPGFLLEAAGEFNIDLKKSWMIGDQDSDVQCGQSVGCKTILIENKDSVDKRGKSKPTFTAADLFEATQKLKGDLPQ